MAAGFIIIIIIIIASFTAVTIICLKRNEINTHATNPVGFVGGVVDLVLIYYITIGFLKISFMFVTRGVKTCACVQHFDCY